MDPAPMLLNAQQIPGLRKYTELDGYTATNGYLMNQDEKGYLWIGTDNGGMCFDGHRFRVLQQVRQLQDADILACVPLGYDRQALLPISSNIRLLSKGRLITDTEEPRLSDKNRRDHNVCSIDSATGTIWLSNAYNLKVLHCFQGKTIRIYRIRDEQFMFKKVIGKQFIGSDKNGFLARYDLEKGRYHYFYSEEGQKISQVTLHAHGDHTNYITGSNPSKDEFIIYRYFPGDSILHRLHAFKYPHNQSFPYVYIDRNQDLWLKSIGNSGLTYYGNVLHANPKTCTKLMQCSTVNSPFVDKNGNLWMTAQNNTLYFLSAQHFRNFILLRRFPQKSEMPKSITGDGAQRMLLSYANSRELVYADEKGFHLIQLNDFFHEGSRKILPLSRGRYILYNKTLAIFDAQSSRVNYLDISPGMSIKDVDAMGNDLVVATNSDVFSLSLTNKGQSPPVRMFKGRSTAVQILPDGRILIGTPVGMYIRAGNNDSVKKIADPLLGNSYITDFVLLNDGSVLTGTNARGLYRYCPDGQVKPVCTTEGKPQHVRYIYRQNDSTYWVASDDGAWSLVFGPDWSLRHAQNYTLYDGLPSSNVNSVYVARDTAYIATTDGLGVLPLAQLPKRPMRPPAVYINSLSTHSDTIRFPKDHFFFGPDQNTLCFSLSAVSYESLGKTDYYYRLYPLQTNWTSTRNSEMRYEKLPPGNYVFEAYATNAMGLKSPEPVRLAVDIGHYFWQTAYFKAGLVLAGMLGMFLVLRFIFLYREKKKIEKIQQKRHLAELELEAIKAQINPHFIYNCLNSIQYLNYTGEHTQAQHYLTLFARLIRMTMHYSRQTFITVTEELEYLSGYLQLEKLRFKEKLEYELLIDRGVETHWRLPPMLIQPYVVNALKHGIAGRETTGRVVIRFEKKKKYLLITITDNGPGITNAASSGSQGLRLAGARARSYSTLFNLHIGIDFPNHSGSGTVVQLTISLMQHGNTTT